MPLLLAPTLASNTASTTTASTTYSSMSPTITSTTITTSSSAFAASSADSTTASSATTAMNMDAQALIRTSSMNAVASSSAGLHENTTTHRLPGIIASLQELSISTASTAVNTSKVTPAGDSDTLDDLPHEVRLANPDIGVETRHALGSAQTTSTSSTPLNSLGYPLRPVSVINCSQHHMKADG